MLSEQVCICKSGSCIQADFVNSAFYRSEAGIKRGCIVKKAKKHSGVTSRLYQSNLLIVIAVILITGLVSLYYAVSVRQKDMDISIMNMAAMVSGMEEVKASLKAEQFDPDVQDKLDHMVDSFEQVDALIVCDAKGIRLYHNNRDLIGLHFQGGDEEDILAGSDPYISTAKGTLGMQRRAFHAIKDDDGTLLGFVTASVLTNSLDRIRLQVIGTFCLLLLAFIVIGAVMAQVSVRRIQKILMGYQPEEFLDLYVERAEVLDSLEEGIFAINKDKNIILMNRQAKNMLDLPPDAMTEGKPLLEVFPETKLVHTLESGKAEYNNNFDIYGKHIISSRIPIRKEEEIIGAVSIFRNKTEVTKLAEELTGAKYMVNTLRAFNHEFMNKLHVILGLLETNQVEDAKQYIMKTNLVSGEAISDISHRVPIANLAALLIGKLIQASELGITLNLKPDSFFHQKEHHLPVDCYITIVGNLLENAMYELNRKEFEVKQIDLGIYSEEGHTIIVCEDTGGGIPEEVLFSIYDRNTTTKGEGHGTGMALIREIVDMYEGTIHIDTDEGEGTCFEIVLPI